MYIKYIHKNMLYYNYSAKPPSMLRSVPASSN